MTNTIHRNFMYVRAARTDPKVLHGESKGHPCGVFLVEYDPAESMVYMAASLMSTTETEAFDLNRGLELASKRLRTVRGTKLPAALFAKDEHRSDKFNIPREVAYYIYWNTLTRSGASNDTCYEALTPREGSILGCILFAIRGRGVLPTEPAPVLPLSVSEGKLTYDGVKEALTLLDSQFTVRFGHLEEARTQDLAELVDPSDVRALQRELEGWGNWGRASQLLSKLATVTYLQAVNDQ